jgi:hypothetical protein
VRTTSTVQSALDALKPGQSSTAVLAFQPEGGMDDAACVASVSSARRPKLLREAARSLV